MVARVLSIFSPVALRLGRASCNDCDISLAEGIGGGRGPAKFNCEWPGMIPCSFVGIYVSEKLVDEKIDCCHLQLFGEVLFF